MEWPTEGLVPVVLNGHHVRPSHNRARMASEHLQHQPVYFTDTHGRYIPAGIDGNNTIGGVQMSPNELPPPPKRMPRSASLPHYVAPRPTAFQPLPPERGNYHSFSPPEYKAKASQHHHHDHHRYENLPALSDDSSDDMFSQEEVDEDSELGSDLAFDFSFNASNFRVVPNTTQKIKELDKDTSTQRHAERPGDRLDNAKEDSFRVFKSRYSGDVSALGEATAELVAVQDQAMWKDRPNDDLRWTYV